MDITVRSEGPWVAEDRSWLGSRHGTDVARSITMDLSAFTSGVHYPAGYIPSGMVIAKLDSGLYGPYAGTTAEVQTITITGTPTGGTFTLTRAGDTTAAIAYNATAAAVKTALEALPGVQSGDVAVGGGPGPGTPYLVTFGGNLTGDQPQMTTTGSLTGGSTPAVAVTTSTPGGSVGTGGTDTPAGHLWNSVQVRAGDGDKANTLLEHGVVVAHKLPANSGFDAGVRDALRGQIMYW